MPSLSGYRARAAAVPVAYEATLVDQEASPQTSAIVMVSWLSSGTLAMPGLLPSASARWSAAVSVAVRGRLADRSAAAFQVWVRVVSSVLCSNSS